MGKQTPFEKFRDSITPMGYVPSQSYAEDVASLQQSDYFLQNFKTPSDIQEYKNYILDTQFRQMGVQSPYESTGDYRARFNPEADINNTLLSGDDTPEQDLFKRISHQIILNRGKLPVASFLEQAVNSSMTAGWAKFLGDNMFDFKGEIPDLHMAEDGIFYKGKRLNLTQEQMNILNDYNAKISGTNKDYSFIEDIAKTATSLVFDAPLLFMTGGISAGAMKLSTVTSALAKSTQYLPRLTGQIIQQGINFNLLGIPQTVESTRQNGLSGMLGSVWHNVTTGSLAAFTGTTGVALGKATGLMFLKNNPAIREEFGGLLGSTGFGYSLGKIEGMSDEDAIAQGLAFAATHFTNPTAYKRVITEMKNRNVRVYAESLANNQDTGMLPDYFIEKDGKYQKIEADAFKREGRIVPMDVEPIEATSSNKMEYLPINSLPDYAQIKFRDALARDRNEKNGQKLYEKWVKDLDPEYVKANADKLRSLAEITSASLVGAKLGEVFGKWKLPADAKLDNQMIKLSKQYSLPYSDVKRFVLENVNEYFISPEDVISRIQENPTVAKDLEGVLKVAGETFVKQAKANYAQELLNKAGIPASRQLTEGTPLKPVDLKTEAERIAEGVRRTDLKKQAVEGVIPATEPKPDKYVFYDFNGELVPMVKEKGKLKIAGTNVEIPFEKVKDKVKTKTEVVKEVKEKASKKTKETVTDETAYAKKALEDAGGASKLSPDQMLEVVRKARAEYQEKNPPKEGTEDGQKKTEVLKETQPSETVAEVKPVEPVESVESKPEVYNDPKFQELADEILKARTHYGRAKPIAENKPEQTQVSTVKETTEPNTNIASTETKATNEPKKEFEFEKSNLLDVVDKVVSDNNYIISQDGKAKINKTISDIKDYARKMGVPEKDVRDFAILTLKEAGLPNAKIANMMKIGGSAISTDAVKKVVERKSNIYGKQAKELSTRRSAEEQPKTLFEEELASQMGKVNMGRKQEDLSGEDLSGKDVGLASLQQGEVVGEQPREITRVRPETRMKRAEDVVKKVLEKYDLEDRKQYEKALKEVSENRYLEEGGDTEVGIAMLQNKKLGRELRDPELLNPTLMFETTGKGTRLTPEQRQADIAKGNEFWNEFGVEVVAGQIPQEPGKPLRSGMFEFNFTDGTGKITIDTTLGRTTTMPHENMHGLMTLAYGKDRALVDRLLKEYGWNGNMKDKSFVDAQEKVITQIQQMPNRNPLVQRLVETWERFANWFQGKGFYSEAQLFRKLASGQIEVAKFGTGDSKIKFYETISKPTEGKTDLLEITDSKEYAKFVEWRDKYLVQTSKVVPVDKVDYALKNNKLSTTAKKIGNKIYQMGIQVNNYVNQVDKNGDYIRPTERGLYLIARDKLVTKMPYEINSVLKNPETWNEGHHFRMLDNNKRKDWTNRNDIASKINQYHLDIYYGKKEAPKLMEGETLEQAHTRIGKDIGLTDAQIKADWKTQQAYAQAMNKAYNATVDMYANLKDDMTGDYIVVDGLSRKQLDKVFGTESIKDEVEAYSRAKEIINANPEKRFEVAVELANKSPFAERQNPFYHSDTRPSNPNFWLVKGKKPTGELKDGKIQWDEFFTYAENEKEANRIAKEWNDKGFAVEEKFNIGKEISDKRYNRLSANQLINLANAGHIPISNETVKALLEATKSGRFEQHSLEKKYVPGMHGTAKEYESQLVNFVNEAMSASVKRYALDEMKDYILKENIMLNQIMKNPATTDIEKTEAKGTSEWMSQFYNQVAQSDRSVVDTLREIATTYYIGFKPSFPFMQMFQPLQMALPEAIKEGGNTGLWAKSLGTAWDLAYEIRARQKGETTGKVEDELFALYDKFDKMNKMGATGIRELTGEAGDIQLHYGSNSYRNWKTFMKFGNMAGAIAEKYTRLQSLAMWYDIAKSKGLSGKAMEDFVLTKHDEVMALWGASGRPVIGQSKEMGTQQQKAIKAFAKSFFTFKTYTMANLGQYDRLMRNRSWGALGTKMAVGVGLHGITKFPLMATFYGLYNLLSDDDLEYEQLKALDEVNAGILGRGISDILPISLQNMFDERTAFVSDAYAETRSKSAEGKLLEAMLGAPYGVPKDMIEGSMAIHKLVMNGIDDDAVLTEDERIRAKKNWSKVLPLAARNVFNAMNMDTDGIQIRGRELVKAEDISWADVVYKVLGFNPSKVANAYELQFSGFPAKWSRINGKIAELKKIRKEIAEEKGYTQLERKTELQNVARLLKEAMSEQSELRKSTDYRSAVKQKLISP